MVFYKLYYNNETTEELMETINLNYITKIIGLPNEQIIKELEIMFGDDYFALDMHNKIINIDNSNYKLNCEILAFYEDEYKEGYVETSTIINNIGMRTISQFDTIKDIIEENCIIVNYEPIGSEHVINGVLAEKKLILEDMHLPQKFVCRPFSALGKNNYITRKDVLIKKAIN